MISYTFSENADFAEICVSPRRELLFSCSGRPKSSTKLLPKEHRTNAKKKIEICLDFHLIFTSPGCSWAPLGHFFGVAHSMIELFSMKDLKSPPGTKSVVSERLGIDFGGLWEPREVILG